MIRSVSLGLLAILCLSILSACAPRGETRTLDQIYKSASDRFDKSLARSSSDEINQKLKQLSAQVRGFNSGEQLEAAGSISEQLMTLTGRAGFTSRPALTEIQRQYQHIAQIGSAEALSDAQRKLLAARTLSILAQELETTAFQVQMQA